MLKIGTQVKHRENGILGVVVPDQFGLGGPGFVMVDFDGDGNIASCSTDELEDLGPIDVQFSPARCEGCVFANSACHRYDSGRMGWILALGAKKRTPTRIYPFCQD